MQDAGVYIHTHVGGSLDQVAGYEVAMPLDSESWTSWTEFSFLHGTQLKAFTETGDDDVKCVDHQAGWQGGMHWDGHGH